MSINYIDSISAKEASGQVKTIYAELKKEMGDVVEPISLHAPLPDLLKGIWGILRETVLVEQEMSRKNKECVGAAVSSSNECPYCVDAHTIMIIGLKDKIAAKAIVNKDLSLISDDELKKLIDWSFNTRFFNLQMIKEAPFDAMQAPEVIGTAVFFHYLNRMVTIFLGPTILPMNISFLKEPMKKMAAAMFSKVLATKKEAGTLDYVEKISTSGRDFSWASTNERVEKVFQYFDSVTDKCADEYIPKETRDFINEEMQKWDGANLKSTKELDELLTKIPEGNRPMAKILYLICLSPHRIQPSHFEDCQKCFGGSSEAILGSFAWASFQAAKRIGSQLAMGVNSKVEASQ